MSSVRLTGNSHADKVLMGNSGNTSVGKQVVQHPINFGHEAAKSQGLTAQQANGLKLLTFAGAKIGINPAVRLEYEFIRSLNETNNVEEKAGVAEMLGRARSINALPHLTPLLNNKEDVKVRIAAVNALARIGGSTDKNSFTRSQLSDVLVGFYQSRKAEAAQKFSKPMSVLLGQKQKEGEARDAAISELEAVVAAISELNSVTGRAALAEDFQKSLVTTEKTVLYTNEMQRIVQIASEELVNILQREYKKPMKEIAKEIHPRELEKLYGQIKVQTGDGEEISMLEAMASMEFLESQQKFAAALSTSLMESLSKQAGNQTTTALKLGLSSSHPGIKAKTLELLAQRGGVSFNADIYPNLKAENKDVRRAAMTALLGSSELSSKQKVLELTNPQQFFQTLGGQVTKESLGQFTGFLQKVAANGDEHVKALAQTATNNDYDAETRQIALLTLGMMLDAPASETVSPSTIQQAKAVIRAVAKDAPGRTPAEQDALTLLATEMWVGMKEPQGIAKAIQLADSKYHRIGTEDQEALLGSVLSVLKEDADRNGSLRNARLQNRVLTVLKKAQAPLLKPEEADSLAKEIGPDTLSVAMSALDPAVTPDTFAQKTFSQVVNRSLIEQLQPAVEPLRPILTRLLDSEKSLPSQMMVTRIVGMLRDKVMVDRLIEKTRDPLKGRINWQLDKSYGGNPSMDGANIRLNAIMSLADIGDAKALPVVLDAIDDPVLKGYVVDPLGKFAADANKNGDAGDIAAARKKLLKIVADPDVSRAARATRLQAANSLFQYKGGVDDLKAFLAKTDNPNFKRHVLAALVSNGYGVDAKHADHDLVKSLLQPELGVQRLHEKGITGQGVEMAIIDGGYVDKSNTEAFQNRVHLPAEAQSPEHYHPTMVMSTAAANGKIKGVAPDATVYSDKWPDFEGADPMEVYKKVIEGKLRGENNVRVINNSWGFSNQNVLVFKEIRDILKSFKSVVDMAEKAGIQIVFAAGNEGEAPGIPKIGTLSLFGMDVDKLTSAEQKDLDYILDKIILVGASNTQGTEDRDQHEIAGFSSVGDSLNRKLLPTVVAPGVDMMVYGWDEANTYPKELVNGTSFASPYTSAVIGLMTQVNPRITPAQIREILTSTAHKMKDVPESMQGKHGEIDPEAAVNAAKALASRKRAKAPEAPKAPDAPEAPKAEEPKEAPKAPEAPKAEEPPKLEAPKTDKPEDGEAAA